MPKFGNPINLASSMGQAFAIQSFFIPVIKKNPNVNNYLKYTAIAYLIGTAAYMYIAYMGSFGKNIIIQVFLIVLRNFLSLKQFKTISPMDIGKLTYYKLSTSSICTRFFLNFCWSARRDSLIHSGIKAAAKTRFHILKWYTLLFSSQFVWFWQ